MNRRALLSTAASAAVVAVLPAVEPMAESLSPFTLDMIDEAVARAQYHPLIRPIMIDGEEMYAFMPQPSLYDYLSEEELYALCPHWLVKDELGEWRKVDIYA